MSYIDDIPSLIAPASARVLTKRAELLSHLKTMLDVHHIPFTFDEDRFLKNKLYAACTLHAQRRIVSLLEHATRQEINLAEVRSRADTFLHRPVSVPLRLLDNNHLDALLCGKEVPQDSVAAQALPWLESTGLRTYVESGASLALLGRRIMQNQGVKNYSDEFHLFTVNLDVVLDNPIKMAEALVHEASHNILNILLEDHSITLRDAPLNWYSPWTKSFRHDRGIVHGFFAFTMVVAFFEKLQVLDFQQQINSYTAFQKQNLHNILPYLREILVNYPTVLRDFINETYACLA